MAKEIKCPHCESKDTEYECAIGNPGIGADWECNSCKKTFRVIGEHVYTYEEIQQDPADFELSLSDVI